MWMYLFWGLSATTTRNASVEFEGYKIYRLDSISKVGAGVCAYVKSTFRTKILRDLTGITQSGLHQLWIQVQDKKMRSILVCIVYNSPDMGLSCLQNELMPNYIQALQLNRDVVVTGNLNCQLRSLQITIQEMRCILSASLLMQNNWILPWFYLPAFLVGQ